MRTFYALSAMILCLLPAGASAQTPPAEAPFHPERFTDLGAPVHRNAVYNHVLGKDAQGRDRYYLGFRGTPWFLLSIDPHTGQQQEFIAKGFDGTPWGMIWASNHKLYITTGSVANDRVFVFDPQTQKLEFLGRATTTEDVVWSLCEAADGKIYGGTYPGAKLVSIDMKTHQLQDLGRISPDQMYIRSVDTAGAYVYANAGPSRPQTWAYHTGTGQKTEILPQELRAGLRWGTAMKRADGQVYVTDGLQKRGYRVDGVQTTAVDSIPPARPENFQGAPDKHRYTCGDGTVVWVNPQSGPEKFFFRARPGQSAERVPVQYEGTSTPLWTIMEGPDGTVYGTTRSPITLFAVHPSTHQVTVLGDPVGRLGQVYSWVWHQDRLYMASYGGSRLSVWDPKRPWRFGSQSEDNPRYLGQSGIGRPSSMIVAPGGEHLLVGGLPPYGKTGGVLTIIELASGKIETLPDIVGQQSIASMASIPGSDLVCLGTTWRGGSASEAAKSAPRLMLWNFRTRTMEFETPVLPEEAALMQMTLVGDRVYCTTADKGHLVVFDPKARQVIHTAALGYGPGSLFGLRYRKEDGMLYAITGESIVRIDPQTYAIERLGTYPGMDYGMAISGEGIFVCAGDRLIRFSIPAAKTAAK